jgi:hypothetical protein
MNIPEIKSDWSQLTRTIKNKKFIVYSYKFSEMHPGKTEINQELILPFHILKGRLMHGADFVKYVPDLLIMVESIFGLKDKTPSFSQLKDIDKKLKKSVFKNPSDPRLFGALVAYIGEIIIKQVGGRWELVNLKNDSTVWMPYIMANNKLYNPFYLVHLKLLERHDVNLFEYTMIELSK